MPGNGFLSSLFLPKLFYPKVLPHFPLNDTDSTKTLVSDMMAVEVDRTTFVSSQHYSLCTKRS